MARFADSSKNAAAKFSDISNDFSASASRRSLYVSDEERPRVVQRAQAYKDLEPEMLQAQKVLVDYISALAAIATDSTASRDASLQATAGGLEKIGMTEGQASAGVALAAKIADALAAGYRSNKAGKAIRDCNPFLQDYLKGLEQIAGTDYVLVLNNEQISAEGYYQGLLHQYAEKEPLGALLLRPQMQQDMDGIARRKAAAAAYVKVLNDIGDGHQKLYDNIEHMSSKRLAMLVEPYVADIAEQSVQVARAY